MCAFDFGSLAHIFIYFFSSLLSFDRFGASAGYSNEKISMLHRHVFAFRRARRNECIKINVKCIWCVCAAHDDGDCVEL